jgi:hypothetical protein
MTNTNCLRGIQCPDCQSDGPFVVTVETNVIMHDDGWIETTGDNDSWGDWSFIRCDACDHHGIVSEFRSNNP